VVPSVLIAHEVFVTVAIVVQFGVLKLTDLSTT
jgi:hypothetical protein